MTICNIYILDEITEDTSKDVIKSIVENQEAEKITMHINCTGGGTHATIGIIQCMKTSKVPIETIVYGSAESGAAYIAIAGTKGMRNIVSNGFLLFHTQFIKTDTPYFMPLDTASDYNSSYAIREFLTTHMLENSAFEEDEVMKIITSIKDIIYPAKQTIFFKMMDKVIV